MYNYIHVHLHVSVPKGYASVMTFSGPTHLIHDVYIESIPGVERRWQYDLPLQQSVMEYNHPGMGTIVQPTWRVQCIHVHMYMVINMFMHGCIMNIISSCKAQNGSPQFEYVTLNG